MKNRIIKFRAWDTKKNRMIENCNVGDGEYLDLWVGPDAHLASYYKDFPLMQFTGLEDKNGKEIYEGDIVNGLSKEIGGNVTRFTYEIFWDNEWKGWGGKNVETRNNPIWGTSPWKDLEIIGNIYENSELLNQ